MELVGKVFVKSQNGMKLLSLDTTRECLRRRQRCTVNGNKVPSLKFVSFKQFQLHLSRYPTSIIHKVRFENQSKL